MRKRCKIITKLWKIITKSPGKIKKSEAKFCRSILLLPFCENRLCLSQTIKKLNSTERGALFRHFCVSNVITTAHAHKSGVILHFFQELSNKKIKALQPKMTKIASRGSCLSFFMGQVFWQVTGTSYSRNPWPSQHSELRLDCSIPHSEGHWSYWWCQLCYSTKLPWSSFCFRVKGHFQYTRWSEEPIGGCVEVLTVVLNLSVSTRSRSKPAAPFDRRWVETSICCVIQRVWKNVSGLSQLHWSCLWGTNLGLWHWNLQQWVVFTGSENRPVSLVIKRSVREESWDI